ncbi:MAG TPA: AI-2E family transporter [Coxiellaceae bacterium]|nr:AI-2E family transporter [Coxiellaceae bacterium]
MFNRQNPILRSVSEWFNRNFSDPGVLGLFFTFVLVVLLFEFFSEILAPLLVSVVLAYLLNSATKYLQHWHVPRLVAVWIVYLLFLGALIFALLGLIPILWKQLTNLVSELPVAIDKGQLLFNDLVKRYPHIMGDMEWQQIMLVFKAQQGKIGQMLVAGSFAIIPNVIEFILYFVLVPILVFFLMKDSQAIMAWFTQFLPSNRSMVNNVWAEVNLQIGNYVRGRVIEIIIVGVVTILTFMIMGLPYAVLLGTLTGLAVTVPYVGGVVATIPVVIIAFLQWGMSADFVYLLVAYTVIQILDGNLLVPLLFSETMNIHPIAIIVSVLVFGSLWGFWGMFFAIPLATLVKAIIDFWPRRSKALV